MIDLNQYVNEKSLTFLEDIKPQMIKEAITYLQKTPEVISLTFNSFKGTPEMLAD